MPAFEKFEGIGYGIAGYGIAESPLVFDDKVIITPCGNKTTMVALDRLTGKTVWESESVNDTSLYTSPVLIRLNGKEVIFTSTLHNDLLVDCNSGHIIWKDWHISGIIPVVKNSQIYSTGEYQKGGTLFGWNNDLSKQAVIWHDTVSATGIGGAVLIKDRIFVSGSERGIFSIDSNTGKVVAKYDSINYCNLIAAGNMVYTYEDRLARVRLFSVNDKSIELAGSFKTKNGIGSCVAHMAISNGLLFIRRGEVLMAYDIKKK
jgi:outer membrane protein assembly factor BamB